MISKILDSRAIPLQTMLFIFALAYFYSGISFSPSIALPLKLLFGGLFILGLIVAHLVIVQDLRVPSTKGILLGLLTLAVLTVFILTGLVFFIVPGVILTLLLFPVPALASSSKLTPAKATIVQLRTLKGALISTIARRSLLFAGIALGFILFFTSALLLLAHGNIPSAFLAISRPSMIHEFIGLFYTILLLPFYSDYVRKILRNS